MTIRRTIRASRLAVAAVLVASAQIVLSPQSAADPPSVLLGLPGLHYTGGDVGLLIDPAHAQILIGSKGGMDVATLDGTSVTHVPDSTWVTSFALSTDKDTLWYQENCALVAVAADDVVNGTRDRIAPPSSVCPYKLVVDSTDRIWFLYRDVNAGTHGLGMYNPATAEFDITPPGNGKVRKLETNEALANNPSDADTLVLSGEQHTIVVDAAAGSVTTDSANPSGAYDVAVTSDGSRYARASRLMSLTSTTQPGSPGTTVTFDPASAVDYNPGSATTALSSDDAYVAGVYDSTMVSFRTASDDHAWVRRCDVPTVVENMAWNGADVWFVSPKETTSLQIGRCDDMALPQSFVHVPRARSFPIGTGFTSSVRLLYRDAPLGNRTLSITRTGPAGSESLPSIVTGPGGRAKFHDTAHSGEQTYAISFAGDGVHPATTSLIRVEGVRAETAFHEPLDFSAYLGRPVTIYDVLDNGYRSAVGKTIHVTRFDLLGKHRLADVVTGRGGEIRATVVPRFGPHTRYVLTFDGDRGNRPSSATYHVHVYRLRAPVSIHLSRPTVPYNERAVVRVHLGRTFRNRTVTLFEQPEHLAEAKVRTGTVDRNGDLITRVAVPRTTRFIARFGGDARFRPGGVRVWQGSVAATTLGLRGSYARSAGTYLYHAGQEVRVVGRIAPGRQGRQICFQRELQRNGSYAPFGYTRCVSTHRDGTASNVFLTRRDSSVGKFYRYRVYFHGDDYNRGSKTPWHYLHITK